MTTDTEPLGVFVVHRENSVNTALVRPIDDDNSPMLKQDDEYEGVECTLFKPSPANPQQAVCFNGEGEIILCSISKDGVIQTRGYFEGDGRYMPNFDISLVELPFLITSGELKIDVEKTLAD